MQAAEIDALRVAIENFKDTKLFAPLMSALYFAMKECVFAKDGHMAQPLGFEKNIKKLLKQRQKSIFVLFNVKFKEFFTDDFAVSDYENECFNMNFEDLLGLPKIRKEVDVVYADPPYTDMQYSRYYHILNFVTSYKPLPLTIISGSHTKGLYTDGRYQSKLSTKSKCLDTFTTLINFCCDFQKDLVVSFACPADTTLQKIDRYVMSIDSLVSVCTERFGAGNVYIHSCEYTHSNNRNSEQKKVLEHLIVCKKK
jgi:adenine-specific DNA methylase